ncbi:MAG TPA: TonB-dependent receptor, partial [Tianweitania sediminis]|nr:TonB-dependent receptor [Tianweitania sediminis]
FHGVTLEANIFRTRISDARLPVYGRSPFAPEATSLRTLDLDTRGFELGAIYEWDLAFISVKYADVQGKVNGVTADSEIGRYLTTPLGQSIAVTAGYTYEPWGLQIGGDVEFVLENNDTLARHPNEPDSAKNALPSYTVANAFAEWTPPANENLTFRAEVTNIFDELYTDRAAYGQDFLGVKPHYDPGRSFRLSATARF